MDPDEGLLNYYVPATAQKIELFTSSLLSKLYRDASDNASINFGYAFSGKLIIYLQLHIYYTLD